MGRRLAAPRSSPTCAEHRRVTVDAPTVDVVNNAGSIVVRRGLRRRPRLPGGRRGPVRQRRRTSSPSAAAPSPSAPRRAAASAGSTTTSSSTTRTPTCRGGCGWPAGGCATSRRRSCATSTRRPAVEWSPTFVFHTTRNRLLMLVKDATADARAAASTPRSSARPLQMARPVVGALRRGRRPAPARSRARLRAARLAAAAHAARAAPPPADRAAAPSCARAALERELVTAPMRAAVYNRFWHSQGGGERHSGMIASVLSHDGVEVDLLGHTDVDKDELADHLGLDLSRVLAAHRPRPGRPRDRRAVAPTTTCSSTART